MTNINAIKIDPFNKTIVQVPFERNSLDQMYALMSNEHIKCDMIQVFSPADQLNLLLDEDGRFKRNNKGFRLNFGHCPQQVYVGIALVVGPISQSNFTSCEVDVALINAIVAWEGVV